MEDKIQSKEEPKEESKETEIPKEKSKETEIPKEKEEPPKEEPQIKTEMCQLIYYDFSIK